MAFCAGDLREHVTLQRKTNGKDARGFPWESWADVCECAAMAQSVSSRDFYQAYAAKAQDVITFTLRWVEGLNTSWCVQFEGEYYEILEVNWLGLRRDYVQLKTKRTRQA